MIRFTSEDLRQLADKIDENKRYHDMCEVVYLTICEHPNGKQYARFEQPNGYPDCNSIYYNFDEK